MIFTTVLYCDTNEKQLNSTKVRVMDFGLSYDGIMGNQNNVFGE